MVHRLGDHLFRTCLPFSMKHLYAQKDTSWTKGDGTEDRQSRESQTFHKDRPKSPNGQMELLREGKSEGSADNLQRPCPWDLVLPVLISSGSIFLQVPVHTGPSSDILIVVIWLLSLTFL